MFRQGEFWQPKGCTADTGAARCLIKLNMSVSYALAIPMLGRFAKKKITCTFGSEEVYKNVRRNTVYNSKRNGNNSNVHQEHCCQKKQTLSLYEIQLKIEHVLQINKFTQKNTKTVMWVKISHGSIHKYNSTYKKFINRYNSTLC